MPISLNAIRNFQGDERFVLGQQGQIQDVGRFHRFKVFFDIGDARKQNGDTLLAIHHAILNDPRYFSQDVQKKAAELLSQVRTDRALGKAQIKGIIDQLDAMSGPDECRSAGKKLFAARLAERGYPDFLPREAQADYKGLLLREYFPENEPAGGYARIKFNDAFNAMETRMRALFTRLGDGQGDVEVLCKKMGLMFRDDSTGGMKSQDRLEAAVDDLKADLDKARELGREFGDETCRAVRQYVIDLEKHIAPTDDVPDPLRLFVTIARSTPADAVNRMSAQSTEMDIHDAMSGIMAQFSRSYAVLSTAVSREETSLPRNQLMLRCFLASLPADKKAGMLAALESPSGKNLLSFYDSLRDAPEARQLTAIWYDTVIQLKTDLGLPNPEASVDRPAEPDMTRINAGALTKETVAFPASGSGAGPINELLMKLRERDQVQLRNDLYANCKAMVTTSICGQISECLFDDPPKAEDGTAPKARVFNPNAKALDFEKDLERGMEVRLQGGEALPADAEAARDKLVQFVTGNAAAKFAEADLPTKMKAWILMTCVAQAIPGIATNAYGEMCNIEGHDSKVKFMDVPDSQKDRLESYALSKDEAGNVTISLRTRIPVHAVSFTGGVFYTLGDGSCDEYEMNITFPAGNLDKLSRADWSLYDPKPVHDADHDYSDPRRHHSAADKVQDAYRFEGTVTMAAHLHHVAAVHHVAAE